VGSNVQTIQSVIEIDESGSATGKIEVALRGSYAARSRSSFRKASKDKEEEWLKKVFTNDGVVGFGRIEKDEPKPLLDTYRYSVDFEKNKLIPLYGIGAFHVKPLLPTGSSISSFLHLTGDIESVEVACRSGMSIEEYEYSFPSNIDIIVTPDNMEIAGAYISYKSTYSYEGQVLKVSRHYEDSTPMRVCSPELMEEQRKQIKKILWDVKSQVVYKVAS